MVVVVRSMCKDEISVWKADIDAAFRRVPLCPAHRRFGHICFRHKGRVYVAEHYSMMFGSIASVHNWDRVGKRVTPEGACAVRRGFCICLAGAFLRTLGRSLLRLPVHRYVDDYFACERRANFEHAMQCFKRLVRACLARDSIADAKCEYGNPLQVLGVDVFIDIEGVRYMPALVKVQKWAQRIASYLEGDRLTGGEAAKLAGALQWASQHAFKRLGRAMLRPIHRYVLLHSIVSLSMRALCSQAKVCQGQPSERGVAFGAALVA